MGNNITTSTADKRFGNSLLAKEVKKIIMDMDMVESNKMYLGEPIKIHLAKACCMDVIKTGVTDNEVVSIAFPEAIDLTNDRCALDGVCLETSYVGLQINEDKEKYCGSGDTKGSAGASLSRTRGGGTGDSVCDNFMMDYCAKSLYDQGCINVVRNSDGKNVPQYIDKNANKMCYDVENKINYGPPECHCVNSIYGPNLNNWPAKKLIDDTSNPYGLSGSEVSADNIFSRYTLDMFKTPKTYQFSNSLDKRCAEASARTNTSKSRAYTLRNDELGQVSICLNQITLNDSNIMNANLDDIKQTNNCGPSTNTDDSGDNQNDLDKNNKETTPTTTTPTTTTPTTTTPTTTTPTTTTPENTSIFNSLNTLIKEKPITMFVWFILFIIIIFVIVMLFNKPTKNKKNSHNRKIDSYDSRDGNGSGRDGNGSGRDGNGRGRRGSGRRGSGRRDDN